MGKKKSYPFPSTILSFTHNFLLLPLIILTFSWDDQQQILAMRSTAADHLQVPRGSTFKIALFADLHYGENAWSDWGPEHDVNSTRVMSIVLDKEQPDFVVYLGDVITANNILVKNASLYWDQAISPTRKRGIPWASVFGNHDDTPFVWPMEWFSAPGIPELICPAAKISATGDKDCRFKGTTRLELMEHEIQLNNLSYSKSGPENLWPSVSNYVLKLSSSADPQLAVAYMYFFDSGGGSYPGVISSAQADWFQQTSQQLNPDSRVPEIIFWHIPSQAYKDVALHKNCVGSMFTEEVAAQDEELGIMKLFERRSSIKAIFVGHNHGLDWCCPHEKLWLCYARHTGYGGYGTWPKGVRILEISEQPFSLKSWIRMEDGDSHSAVVLSSSH